MFRSKGARMATSRRGRKEKRVTRSIESENERKNRHMLRAINFSRHQWIRFFSFLSVLLMAVFTLTAIVAFNHYRTYPGVVERDSITAEGRGADYISLSWDEASNTEVYKVFYKEHDKKHSETELGEEVKEEGIDSSWKELDAHSPSVTVKGLNEDTSYAFVVRADSEKKEGLLTEPRSFRTKKPQDIKVAKTITKFTCSKPFKIRASAETDLVYESSDPEVAVVDPETNKIQVKGPGDTEISIKAEATTLYEEAHDVVELKVIEADPVPAGGASAHIIYHLDADNCEVVKKITGADGAVIPQGLAYTGDKYIVSYGMGNPNRVISFDVDGEGKKVSVPKVSMGHPNGFTFANENGRCYCVKGWTSTAYTYEPTSDSYGSINLSYGCSGIGYDRKEKLLYTCSRTAMVAYDISDGYSVKYRTGVVKHSGTVYTQDCGGHAGLMLRCLSGGNKHGTNYIDIYDMKNGNYLGTLSCDLSEVESCIVDDDGFLEILANNSGSTDYIWKTGLNIETLGEGL